MDGFDVVDLCIIMDWVIELEIDCVFSVWVNEFYRVIGSCIRVLFNEFKDAFKGYILID